MGTWGAGPFENDGAADFITNARAMPAPSIAQALLSITDAAPDDYLDVDDGQAAVAAAELVALGYGYGKLDDATRPTFAGSSRRSARTRTSACSRSERYRGSSTSRRPSSPACGKTTTSSSPAFAI